MGHKETALFYTLRQIKSIKVQKLTDYFYDFY